MREGVIEMKRQGAGVKLENSLLSEISMDMYILWIDRKTFTVSPNREAGSLTEHRP